MSHSTLLWEYSHNPKTIIEKEKCYKDMQDGRGQGETNDIRRDKLVSDFWKYTEASVSSYVKPLNMHFLLLTDTTD